MLPRGILHFRSSTAFSDFLLPAFFTALHGSIAMKFIYESGYYIMGRNENPCSKSYQYSKTHHSFIFLSALNAHKIQSPV